VYTVGVNKPRHISILAHTHITTPFSPFESFRTFLDSQSEADCDDNGRDGDVITARYVI
jgi:hypothetical protein